MNNWFKVLWNLDDAKLVKINGIDYTLYLVFLRLCAAFFLFLTVFNAIIMVPIYVTNDPANTEVSMEKISVINIANSPPKVTTTYFITLIVVSSALMVTL